MKSLNIRFYLVLFLIIISNIVNMLFPKGMGYEVQTGFQYEISKYTYGLCLVLMLPSLISSKRFYFSKMRWMALMIVVYIYIAQTYRMPFFLDPYLKMLMICLSFIFFEEAVKDIYLKKWVIYSYLLSVFINIAYLTLTQNRLEIALENEGHVGGGQSLATSMIYLLPLLFYLFKGKLSSYLFLIGLFAVIVSLRRTAILAYLLCLPFVFQRIRGSISKKQAYLLLIGVVVIAYYIYSNYWFIIEDRFANMTEASEEGYYGSGRTGWWAILYSSFIDSPGHWLQGFGLGRVSIVMAEAGFPYGGAHNDYIEVGYTFGFIGLFLWFGTILSIYKLSKQKSLKPHSTIIKMASVSYLFIALVSGATYQPHFMCIALFSALMLKEKQTKWTK